MQPEMISSSDEVMESEIQNTMEKASDKRKSSKPIMEKRRRARINNSLNELKMILLEALKKDSTRHSKLEKADILEMTVNYLKNVERQRISMSLSIDPNVVDKYKAGFNQCRNEVMKFLSTCEGITVEIRTRLLNHLASCLCCLQSYQTNSNIFVDSSFDNAPVSFLPIGHTSCGNSFHNLPSNSLLANAAPNINSQPTFDIQEENFNSLTEKNLFSPNTSLRQKYKTLPSECEVGGATFSPPTMLIENHVETSQTISYVSSIQSNVNSNPNSPDTSRTLALNTLGEKNNCWVSQANDCLPNGNDSYGIDIGIYPRQKKTSPKKKSSPLLSPKNNNGDTLRVLKNHSDYNGEVFQSNSNAFNHKKKHSSSCFGALAENSFTVERNNEYFDNQQNEKFNLKRRFYETETTKKKKNRNNYHTFLPGQKSTDGAIQKNRLNPNYEKECSNSSDMTTTVVVDDLNCSKIVLKASSINDVTLLPNSCHGDAFDKPDPESTVEKTSPWRPWSDEGKKKITL